MRNLSLPSPVPPPGDAPRAGTTQPALLSNDEICELGDSLEARILATYDHPADDAFEASVEP